MLLIIWLFFFVHVWARGKTESINIPVEYNANFPKLFHLDDYERCLARVDGVYCLGVFHLTPATLPHRTYELMKEHSDETHGYFNRTRIHRGYCLSTRCPILPTSSNASLNFERNASLRFERCVDRYAQVSGLRASFQTFHYCRTHSDVSTIHLLTTAEHIFKLVVYALILANILGTIYDIYAGNSSNKNKLLSAFSIPANWHRLTVIREDGDRRLTALGPIEGARVWSLGVTLFAHASILHYSFYLTNPDFAEKVGWLHILSTALAAPGLNQGSLGLFLADGTALIQALVMTSCFLASYTLLILSEKQKLGLYMLPMCIIKRYIRISPVHLLIVGYGATWWISPRDGPLVSTTIGLESDACKTKFWSHVFLVNNIVDPKDYCVAPTWFLPVNMHMYILSSALTLLFWSHRSFAIKLYTFLFFISCLLIAVIGYIKEYKPMVHLTSAAEVARGVFRDAPSFTEFYISSWGALPSCFIGLILAHVQYELGLKKIKLSDHKWFDYLHNICLFLLFTWPLTGVYAHSYNHRLFNAVYLILGRTLYCVMSAIGLLGMFNMDGFFTKFFSWRGYRAIARMSLTVMMLHWCVNMAIGARPMAYNTSVLDILVTWSAVNVITYGVAVPVTVMVEIPMQRFLDTLLF